ncbi:exopolysaccharide production repressor protein [Rhizobium paknamense]|uniref:Exopolysaccharide production repressor protein n=1 Tax=Rhizobium paknamense TaxID=1206817 RepID=A0ABU0IJG8_9HYPH|nr:exopolysaccharide production repressor protein [Rhizobium paknamense]MDQ0458382.1 exopolysaccharide production repressor protein [Rhizobium paknamense]
MKAPKVFFSMIGALVIFALITYYLTGSIGSTALKTVLCAVLIQVGYFCAMLYLVYRESQARKAKGRVMAAGVVREDGVRESKAVTSLQDGSHGVLRNH